MRPDNLISKLCEPSFLMEISNEAANEETIQQHIRDLIKNSRARSRITHRTRRISSTTEPMQMPLHIKRLANLDACTLAEVIEGTIGEAVLLDRLSKQTV